MRQKPPSQEQVNLHERKLKRASALNSRKTLAAELDTIRLRHVNTTSYLLQYHEMLLCYITTNSGRERAGRRQGDRHAKKNVNMISLERIS